jgi:hypothetical protein
MATPTGIAVAARQAASGYALRALPRRKTYTTSRDINTASRTGWALTAAWQQVNGLAAAGAQVTAFTQEPNIRTFYT